MNINSKIYIAGHRGLVGSALVRCLQNKGYQNILGKSHAELDLEDYSATLNYIQSEQPEYVIIAAARVGGIYANNTYPVDFLMANLALEMNVIRAAYKAGVKRLIFLGSSCIYPKHAPQPIIESALLTSELEPTNRPYALAKIAGIEMCWSYNRQYQTQYLAAMPTNLYGIGDNYHAENSHVLPALIRKIHDAKRHGQKNVTLWGTGKPRREFLFSDDLAFALVHLLELTNEDFANLTDPEQCPLINIGCGEDVTIAELATTIAEVIGYDGGFDFDLSKPDGTFQKLLDVSKIESKGWAATTSLQQGVKLAYEDFLKNHATDYT